MKTTCTGRTRLARAEKWVAYRLHRGRISEDEARATLARIYEDAFAQALRKILGAPLTRFTVVAAYVNGKRYGGRRESE